MSIAGGKNHLFSRVLLLWKSSFVHNTKFSINLSPVTNWHCPFLCRFKSG